MEQNNIRKESFEEFTKKIEKRLGEHYKKTAEITVCTTKKNNGIELTGVSIKGEGNMAPTIYLEKFFKEYENGKTLADVVREIVRIVDSHIQSCDFDVDGFCDYEKIKHKIVYRLISTDKNEALLREVPYIEYMDMSIIFYCSLNMNEYLNSSGDEEEGAGSIVIYNSHLEIWNKTVEEIYEQAKINTPKQFPAEILGIEELLMSMFKQEVYMKWRKDGASIDDEMVDVIAKALYNHAMGDIKGVPMYVLSNKQRRYGAATILYDKVLESFSIKSQHNFYILPSSIHEVILVGDDDKHDLENLKSMVCEVNRSQVPYEDILSDSVYYYDRELAKVIRM